MEQNRLKSWALWLSVSALVSFVLKTYLKFEVEGFDTLINMVLVVLTGFGILNNPTDSEKF